ncbi:MAG: transglycosylase domain-containing protein [bacterium]|nr:transglycosylase domain-containing protein [bacterium]
MKTATSNKKRINSKCFLFVIKFLFTLLIVSGVTGISVGIGAFVSIMDSAPDIDDTSIVVPEGYASTIYDSKGNLTQTLVMEGTNRYEATFDELPTHLINAFIAIEDSRFWTNSGIDPRSILRAAVGVLTNDYKGGGSTITQQLIKNNVFNGGMEESFGEKIERKLQEQYLAVQLTKKMDKKLILVNYLNTINLGNNTLGVKAAAKRYFNKDVSELTLSESAVIAGITQNPSKLNPITGKEANEEKRKVILQYMVDQGLISKDEQEEALADNVYERIQNIDLVTKQSSSQVYSYFTDELIDQVLDALVAAGYSSTQAHNMIYGGGLQIYTTQDPDIQSIVDEEINNPDNYSAARYSMEYRLSVTHENGETEHYSENNVRTWRKKVLGDQDFDELYDSQEAAQADADAYKEYILQEGDTVIGESFNTELQPQASFVVIDQETGYVKALSGGRGEKKASLTLNRASDVLRQPGSTFKVLTAFAPAIDTCGATLGTVYYDGVYTIGTKTFRNWYSSRGYLGYSNIREGIIYSMNIVAVRCLMETVTPQLGVEYAQNLGISTLTSTDLNASTALGGITDGVSNLELTAAYAAIANGGVYNKPIFFTKILDRNGKIILENEPQSNRVLKDSTAFLLTDAMAASMKSGKKYARTGITVNPTSTGAALSNMSVAGKSGTTTSNRDIWFVGYTPYYTAGIWAGCDENQELTAKNGGSSFHKQIWKKIMDRVHSGLTDTGFERPDSIETAQICRKSGKLAVDGVCDQDPRGSAVYTEYFAKGTVPTEVCDHHVRVTVCSASGGLPTQYCPSELRTSTVCMVIPSDEVGTTDDSIYGIPAYCSVHTAESHTETAENESEAEETTPIVVSPNMPLSPSSNVQTRIHP